MVRLQTLDLRIGVRVPASQPFIFSYFREVSEPQGMLILPVLAYASPGPAWKLLA